jgi:hypothetical protein
MIERIRRAEAQARRADEQATKKARGRLHRSSRVNAHTESPGPSGDAIQLTAAKRDDPASLAARAAASEENKTLFWTRIFSRLLQRPDDRMPNEAKITIVQLSEDEWKY